MSTYTFVPLHIGRFIGAVSDSHREIIQDYAARGYRYVGYFPTKISDYGKLIDLDLIFEKEE